MTLLHIALQEGFVDDDVVIKVNRTKVYQKNMVKTRFQIGLADYVDLDISKKKGNHHGLTTLEGFIELNPGRFIVTGLPGCFDNNGTSS